MDYCVNASFGEAAYDFSTIPINNYTCATTSLGYLSLKFWLVSVFGSFLSLVGVVQNGLLAYLFISRKKFRESNMYFLGVAAIFDALLDFTYPFLMSISVLWEYYESEPLLHLWHFYVRQMNALSNVSMTASSCLLTLATYERFRLTMTWRSTPFTLRSRSLIILCALLLAFLLKAPIMMEIVVVYLPECAEFNPLGVYFFSVSCLTTVQYYKSLYQFWVRKLLCIVLPFLLLTTFNCCIVWKARAPQKNSMMDMRSAMLTIAYGEKSLHKHRKQVHRATRTMVLVASCYLLTHFLNFFVSTWEMIDKETLQNVYFTFYTVSLDFMSILAVFGNVARLWIYCISDKEIRKPFLELLSRIFICCKRFQMDFYQLPPEQLVCHCYDQNGGDCNREEKSGSGNLDTLHATSLDHPEYSTHNGRHKDRRLSHIYG